MEEKSGQIPTISCGHCVMTIKRELGELEGITSVDADEHSKMVTIKWDSPATWKKIADTLEEIGYPMK